MLGQGREVRRGGCPFLKRRTWRPNVNSFLETLKDRPSVGNVFIEEADVPAKSASPLGKVKHLYVIRVLENSTTARKYYLSVSFQTQKG